MSKRTNTPNAHTNSTIIAASNRISQIIANAEKNNADLTGSENDEVNALTVAIFASTPQTKHEAAAVYNLALEHLECAADNVGIFDAATLHRAFKSAQPLLAAA